MPACSAGSSPDSEPAARDDERALTEEWTGARHRAWRVADTTPGTSLRLTDLASGETLDAMNGAVSRCTRPGELVFAAVVPTGDGWDLPCHPVGLSPEVADTLVTQLGADGDPLAVAATAFGRIRRAGIGHGRRRPPG